MRWKSDIWRERSWRWLIPLAFLVLNLLAFGIYRARFAGGVEQLEAQYAADAAALAQLQESRVRAGELMQRAERQQAEIDQLYEVRFATEDERFTDLLREVRQLARSAGLDPGSYSYPETELSDFSLVQRNVNFPVEGTYEQLRTFLNLLELSDQFVTLTQVSLSSSSNSRTLGVRLSLITYFRDSGFDPDDPRSRS